MEGLVGDGFIEIPNFPKFFVKLYGTYLFGSFVRIEFRNVDERALHFASAVFELNGLGTSSRASMSDMEVTAMQSSQEQ